MAPVTATAAHMSRMTLRTAIESLIVEINEDPFLKGAPLDVASERLTEILATSAPRVLTTLEDLNSEAAFEAVCIMPEGGPLRVPISRIDGVNFWQEPGFDGEYTSGQMLAHFARIGAEPSFTLIEG